MTAPGANQDKDREPLQEMLREEFEALGLMSYHGTASGTWFADLTPEDVGKIRVLIHESARESARVAVAFRLACEQTAQWRNEYGTTDADLDVTADAVAAEFLAKADQA